MHLCLNSRHPWSVPPHIASRSMSVHHKFLMPKARERFAESLTDSLDRLVFCAPTTSVGLNWRQRLMLAFSTAWTIGYRAETVLIIALAVRAAPGPAACLTTETTRGALFRVTPALIPRLRPNATRRTPPEARERPATEVTHRLGPAGSLPVAGNIHRSSIRLRLSASPLDLTSPGRRTAPEPLVIRRRDPHPSLHVRISLPAKSTHGRLAACPCRTFLLPGAYRRAAASSVVFELRYIVGAISDQ